VKVMRWRSQPDWPGIEFDYCCCHASYALRARGLRQSWSTQPETVSDYDKRSPLPEPLTKEDVLNIIEAKPSWDNQFAADTVKASSTIAKSICSSRKSQPLTKTSTPRLTSPKIESGLKRFCTSWILPSQLMVLPGVTTTL